MIFVLLQKVINIEIYVVILYNFTNEALDSTVLFYELKEWSIINTKKYIYKGAIFNATNSWRNNISGFNTCILLNLIVFCISIALYLVNEFYFKKVTNFSFIHGYYNDVLAPILLLCYSNILLTFYKKKVIRILSFRHIMCFIFVVGMYWEYITPLYKADSVSDIYDIASYLFGALIYYCVVSRFINH